MYQSKKNVQKQISNTHVKKNTDEKVLSKIKENINEELISFLD